MSTGDSGPTRNRRSDGGPTASAVEVDPRAMAALEAD